MEELVKVLLQKAMELGCKYKFRYYDYKKDEFVMPALLTEQRIERLLTDKSIAEIHIIIET